MSAAVVLDMRAAFRLRLLTIPEIPAYRAWEGEKFTPPASAPWLREKFQPVAEERAGMGSHGLNRHRFLASVSLFYPAGFGTRAIEEAAGAIFASFLVGLPLTYNQSRGEVDDARRGAIEQQPNWLVLPVNIRIISYTTT